MYMYVEVHAHMYMYMYMAHVSIGGIYMYMLRKGASKHNKEYSCIMTSWDSDTCDQLLLLLTSTYGEYGPHNGNSLDVCVRSICFPFVACFSSQISFCGEYMRMDICPRDLLVYMFQNMSHAFGYAPNSLHKVVQSLCVHSCVCKCMVAAYMPM